MLACSIAIPLIRWIHTLDAPAWKQAVLMGASLVAAFVAASWIATAATLVALALWEELQWLMRDPVKRVVLLIASILVILLIGWVGNRLGWADGSACEVDSRGGQECYE